MPRREGDILRGSLDLMVLKTLQTLGPLHGYRMARRIEQISGHHLALNQGSLYPALVRLEQLRWIASRWGESDSGRKVKIYSLTAAGRRELRKEEAAWRRATDVVDRFFRIPDEAES